MDTNTVIFAGILLVMVIISVCQYIYKAKENDGVITKDEVLNIIDETKKQVINDVFTIAAFRDKSEVEQNEILMENVTSFIASSSLTDQEKKLIEANMETIVNKIEEEVKDKLEDIKMSDAFNNIVNSILDNAAKSNKTEETVENVTDTNIDNTVTESTEPEVETIENSSINVETKTETVPDQSVDIKECTESPTETNVEETKSVDEDTKTEEEPKETTTQEEVVAEADTKSEF